MKRLQGKVAIVTGASRKQGIGTAICRAFAREGADVFFTYWSPYDRLMEYAKDEPKGWHPSAHERAARDGNKM